jgi:threonine dehydratase
MNHIDYLQLIENADVYSLVKKTPLEYAKSLTARLGNKILLKREDLHPIYSFKIRGAFNKINQLSEEQLKNGVICSSAGNHGQGVALAAQQKNIRAVIVMPLTTPSIKVSAVRSLEGEIVLYGNNYDEAYDHAKQLGKTIRTLGILIYITSLQHKSKKKTELNSNRDNKLYKRKRIKTW